MLANITAGISVGKQGTATVAQAELLNVLHSGRPGQHDRKVRAMAEARAQVDGVARARPAGRPRERLLRPDPSWACLSAGRARAGCDRLIVALNTDASVRRLKGPTRPVQNEDAGPSSWPRLSPVDMVVLFDEERRWN